MQIDLSQFHDVFRSEAEMLLADIEASVGLLEPGNPDPALIEVIFRSAHSLKGAAASLRLTEIRDLAQALESAFDTRRGGLVGDALLSAAVAASLLVREILPVLEQTSSPLRAAASRASAHLLELSAPRRQDPQLLDAAAAELALMNSSMRFLEAGR